MIVKEIENYTNEWLKMVELTSERKNKPQDITNLFTNEAVLWGTISSKLRTSHSAITDYFDTFAHLPNLKVIGQQYNIKVISENVCVNNALIEWSYDSKLDTLKARMTFIFKKCLTSGKWLIFELHSSECPD